MQFSTLNESDLHHSLKFLYATTYKGKTEVEQDGHVYDIVTKNGNVIEIQTGNLSKLLPKIQDTIQNGHNVKIVYPLVITRRILLTNEEGKKISYRKSPKKGNIYDIFDELTGIYSILLNKHFSLEVVEVEITEERIRTKEPVQTTNKRRRFRKNWYKTNKKLDTILQTRIMNTKDDWKNLFSKLDATFSSSEIQLTTQSSLQPTFCAKDLNKILNIKNGNLILWVLVRMKVIEFTEVKNRSRYYRFV